MHTHFLVTRLLIILMIIEMCFTAAVFFTFANMKVTYNVDGWPWRFFTIMMWMALKSACVNDTFSFQYWIMHRGEEDVLIRLSWRWLAESNRGNYLWPWSHGVAVVITNGQMVGKCCYLGQFQDKKYNINMDQLIQYVIIRWACMVAQQ